jgi:hypothetical protein
VEKPVEDEASPYADRLAGAMSFHLRPPSVDKGVSAFFWALGFFLFMWLGMIAVGVGKGTAFILSAVAGGAIFLYIRLYGEDRPTRSS